MSILACMELGAFTIFLYAASYLPPTLRAWYPWMFHVWCRSFVRALEVDLRLHQKNVRPMPRQYILIANHPSAFEDVGVPALFNVRSLAKVEVKSWYLLGRISQAAGTLYLRREDRDSRRSARQQIVEELAQGRSLCIYPEGGCKGRRINAFRHGIFEISQQTGVPILPVFLHYEAQEDFEWCCQSLPLKLWQIRIARNRRANYYLYDAIDPADFAGKEQYCDAVRTFFLQWQAKYLE